MKTSLTRFLERCVLALLARGITFLPTVTLTEAKKDIKNVNMESKTMTDTLWKNITKSCIFPGNRPFPFAFSELPEFSYK